MTEHRLRVVVDTNVLLSFLIKRDSVPGAVVRRVLENHELLLSEQVLDELAAKCEKDKFRRYFSRAEGEHLVLLLAKVGERIVIPEEVKRCRDPKDDVFLALALCGNADLIVSGDKDLTDLRQIEHIPILSPRAAALLLEV